MLTNSLRCRGCGQSSSPRVGEGYWETLGKLTDASVVARCTKCGAGVALYVFSTKRIPKDEIDKLLAIKQGAVGTS